MHRRFRIGLPKMHRLKSKEPPQTFVPQILASSYPKWANCKGFLEPKSVIDQKFKNLQLEKCRYIKDIQIMFWDTAQYFHSKQLRKSFEEIFSLKFVQVGYKRPTSFFQTNIVTCFFMPASLNLQVQLSYFYRIIYIFFKKKIVNFGIFLVMKPAERSAK